MTKISDLKGKITPISNENINKQMGELRDEWDRKTFEKQYRKALKQKSLSLVKELKHPGHWASIQAHDASNCVLHLLGQLEKVDPNLNKETNV